MSWTSEGFDGSGFGIAARRFDASGIPIGSEFVVNTYTTGHQVFGDLAVEANGNFVVVWEDGAIAATAPAPPSSASATTPRVTGSAASSR